MVTRRKPEATVGESDVGCESNWPTTFVLSLIFSQYHDLIGRDAWPSHIEVQQ